MGLTANDQGGGDFKSLEPGSYVARLVRLVDIGGQTGEYEGKATLRHQVVLSWETPLELMEGGEFDGKPFMISAFLTLSLSDKATLRKYLENWRGRPFTPEELAGFDLRNIMSKPCLLSVGLSKTGKAKVTGVMALPKGMVCPPQVTPSLSFDLDLYIAGDPAMIKVFNEFSDKMKAMILASEEVKDAKNALHTGAEAAPPPDDEHGMFNPDDEIPF